MKRRKKRTTYTKLRSRISKRKKVMPGLLLIKVFVFILILTLTGLIYAKHSSSNVLLSRDIHALNKDLADLENRHQQLRLNLYSIRSHKNLERLIHQHKLPLKPPEKDQIIRLDRPEPLCCPSMQNKGGAPPDSLENDSVRLVQR